MQEKLRLPVAIGVHKYTQWQVFAAAKPSELNAWKSSPILF